jgi:hypothetical protein
MTDELKTRMMGDPRPDYDPPMALRLTEPAGRAHGDCDNPGSGDDTFCWGPGNSAATCDSPGNDGG